MSFIAREPPGEGLPACMGEREGDRVNEAILLSQGAQGNGVHDSEGGEGNEQGEECGHGDAKGGLARKNGERQEPEQQQDAACRLA